MTGVELRERWDTLEGRALAREVSAWLHGRSRRPKKLASIQGRADLRGLLLRHVELASPTSERGTVRGVRWAKLDFRGARLDYMRLFSLTIDDCVFDGASLSELRVWEFPIVDSSFAGANLRYASLGTGPKYARNQWSGVSFRLADLRGAGFDAADLTDIDFSHAKLKDCLFRHCRLDGLTFAGDVRDVLFENTPFSDGSIGYPMRNIDFSQAAFRDVTFRGSHFDNVAFPSGQKRLEIPCFPVAARYVLDHLPSDHSEGPILKAVLENRLSNKLIADDSTGVFWWDDMVRWRNEAFAQLFRDSFEAANSARKPN
ncbi:pentapeptide repeat-containing protein [Leifsonia sp. 2MCAF36]|uniref:pentapeptide repeat-containing protein n=1 Tax=Leifsonia sp. 2MCAF36 TaxID=3232988 RepID=UPI003F9DED08